MTHKRNHIIDWLITHVDYKHMFSSQKTYKNIEDHVRFHQALHPPLHARYSHNETVSCR